MSPIVPQSLLLSVARSRIVGPRRAICLHQQRCCCRRSKFLVASDHPSAIERGDSQMVLWPNPTSRFLSRFTIRRPSRATLDLGTGSGILSLEAAAHSDLVVATDLNPRVPSFVNFNARLNGIQKIEMLLGDAFQPVAGRSFDLILSNPPFFITPRNDFTFCDNPLELDQLCRQLVREAPNYLNEGGYMQMLCEWAQMSGQPWEERIAEWLDGSGCDVWVMKGSDSIPRGICPESNLRDCTEHGPRSGSLRRIHVLLPSPPGGGDP